MRTRRYPIGSLLLIASGLLLVGYGLFVGTGVGLLFYVCSAAIAALCAYHGASSIFMARVNVGALISSQSMLWYTVPFSYIGFFGYDNFVHEVPEIANAQSVAIVAAICGPIFFFFERYGRLVSMRGLAVDWGAYAPVVIPVVLAQAFLIATGAWGYTTIIGFGDEKESSLWVQIVIGLAPAMMPMCSVALASMLRRRRQVRSVWALAVCVGAILIELFFWTSVGRRFMTVNIVVSTILFFSVYFGGRLTSRRVVGMLLFCVAMVFVVSFLWDAYYTLRIATNNVNGGANFTILDLAKARELASGNDVGREIADNLVIRPFLLVTSLTVVRETATGFLWGWNVLSQVLLTVPGAFFPGKFEFIGPVIEGLWTEALGIPLNDWSNTVFLEGYTDFGFFGFAIYTSMIVLILGPIFYLGKLTRFDAVQVFVFLNTLFTLLNAETTMNSVFVSCRSTLILIAVAFVVRFFMPLAVERRSAAGRPR